MAVSFSIADLPNLASLAAVHPSPHVFWTWVKDHTTSGELKEIADKMIFDWDASGSTMFLEAKRLADAVQELQAITQTLTVIRSEDRGQGEIVTAALSLVTASV